MLLAIECIGLLTILDREVFGSYGKVFLNILRRERAKEDEHDLKEKIIALKSTVDGLTVHGVTGPETQELFECVTQEYLTVENRFLRQVAIEGVCKMLFSTKLCEDQAPDQTESILSMLIIQLFDKKYNWQNSLVRSTLTIFFSNFVLFSKQRCYLMLNATTNVIYSILRAKY
jgi:hypothetical protein